MSITKYYLIVWIVVLGNTHAESLNDKDIYKNDLIRRLAKRVSVLEESNRVQQQLLERLKRLLHSRDNAHMGLLNRVISLETRERARDNFQENQPKYFDEIKTKTQDQLQEELTESVERGYQIQHQAIETMHKTDQLKSDLRTEEPEIIKNDKSSAKLAHIFHKRAFEVDRTFKTYRCTGNEGNRIRRVGNEMTVAFTAVLYHSMTNLGPNQNIVFDHVETNIGNGYNPHHGVFIAPVAGIYVFYASLLSEKGNTELYCHIVVNGIKKVTLYEYATSTGYAQGSNMLVIHLNQGADVAVQTGNGGYSIHGSDVNFYPTFSGFLFQQSNVELIG